MDPLLEFLKKHSSVDIDFIEDFLKISEGDRTHDPFKIDLDIMAKWLNSTKGHLKDTLVDSYKENIDYILLTPNRKQKGSGGHNKEIILLTDDCFRSMTLRSKSPLAEKVRYYYITLEKLVKVYKDDIIYKQGKEIELLKYNLIKKTFPVKGMIYVISIDDGYKIGKTNDMNKRYETYKTAHKNNPMIKYIFYSDDITKLESCIKNILKDHQYRDRKEFYTAELVKIIEAIKDCDAIITKFECRECGKIKKINKLKNHIDKHHAEDGKIKFH